MNTVNNRLMRSLLYVPGHNSTLVSKAAAGSADVIVIDFEDAVPVDMKPIARERLNTHAHEISSKNKTVAVRVNAESDLLLKDISAIAAANVNLIVLPKVESAEQIQTLANAVKNDSIEIIGLIESPQGLINAQQIAAAHPNLIALSIGSEDLSFVMQMKPCWDSLLVPSVQVSIACKAENIEVLGYVGSISEFRDLDAFASSVNRSVPLGFSGGFAIHPAQVPILNNAFSPSDEEVAHARRVVDAFAFAQQNQEGAIAVDGKMVDLPVALRAKNTLSRFNLIELKEKDQITDSSSIS